MTGFDAATGELGGDHVAIEADMRVELSQAAAGGPFEVTLLRHEIRWFDDDPRPDYAETVVCENSFAVPLPAVFAALDRWLMRGHRLKVLAHTWRPGESGGTTGVVLLLEGRAIPAVEVRAAAAA